MIWLRGLGRNTGSQPARQAQHDKNENGVLLRHYESSIIHHQFINQKGTAPWSIWDRFSNRVHFSRNVNFTSPVGPLRCLAMITSAVLSGWSSGSPRR